MFEKANVKIWVAIFDVTPYVTPYVTPLKNYIQNTHSKLNPMRFYVKTKCSKKHTPKGIKLKKFS